MRMEWVFMALTWCSNTKIITASQCYKYIYCRGWPYFPFFLSPNTRIQIIREKPRTYMSCMWLYPHCPASLSKSCHKQTRWFEAYSMHHNNWTKWGPAILIYLTHERWSIENRWKRGWKEDVSDSTLLINPQYFSQNCCQQFGFILTNKIVCCEMVQHSIFLRASHFISNWTL